MVELKVHKMNTRSSRFKVNLLVFYLTLLGGPFFWGFLPALVVFPTLKHLWLKPSGKLYWRTLSIALPTGLFLTGLILTIAVRTQTDQVIRMGFPLSYSLQVGPGPRLMPTFIPFAFGWLLHGLNTAIVVMVGMLPVTMLSYRESKRRSRT